MSEFDKMWEEHAGLIQHHASSYAGRYSVPVDLMLQSARMALAVALEEPRDNFAGFLNCVVKRKMQDDALEERGWKRIRTDRGQEIPNYSMVDVDGLSNVIVDSSIRHDPDSDVVTLAAARLPKLWQRILWLYYADGLTQGEIGLRVGCTQSNASIILRRATDSLRGYLC